jgi:hypothetical protein
VLPYRFDSCCKREWNSNWWRNFRIFPMYRVKLNGRAIRFLSHTRWSIHTARLSEWTGKRTNGELYGTAFIVGSWWMINWLRNSHPLWNPKVITILIRVHLWNLELVELMLSSHLCLVLTSGLFPSDCLNAISYVFPHPVCAAHSFLICAYYC